MRFSHSTHCAIAASIALFAVASAAPAAIVPASIFTDDAILQRDLSDPVWGTANPGEPIMVTMNGTAAATTAGADGKWSLKLPPLAAGGPFTLTIAGAPGDTVVRHNVLVGEVWEACGQSNMRFQLRASREFAAHPDNTLATCADPLLRFFSVDEQAALQPNTLVKGAWQTAAPTSITEVSAVAYYFARQLRRTYAIPVGIINNGWASLPAEALTSREALQSQPALTKYLDKETAYGAGYPKALEDYHARYQQYLSAKAQYDTALAAAPAAGTPRPQEPQKPDKPAAPDKWLCGAAHAFNGMVAPIIPYAIRGTIWYQGESNLRDTIAYRTLFPTLIADWRKKWGQGDFPFLFVQLPAFGSMNGGADPDYLVGLREAQRLTALSVPHTAMVVTIDKGDQHNFHPTRKQPVGERLALAARAVAYGEKIEYSGPVLDGIKIDGSRVRITFTHAEGLRPSDVHDGTEDGPVVVTGDKLVGFAVAGADQHYHKAEAAIDGATVIVSSPEVSTPVAVRYAWADYPTANLSNSAGLPASPFTTDNWTFATLGAGK